MKAPSPPPPPARPPSPAGRSTWLVGVLAVVVLAYILVNTLRTQGVEPPAPDARLAPFAAPAVLSDLEGDANVATAETVGDEAGGVPACDVRGPDVVNSCELAEGRPLVLGFFFSRGADCAGSFDRLQELGSRHRGLAVAGVIVRGDREDARTLVREKGWTFPVAFDRDGGVANLYGVAGCPQVVLAYPGGQVRETVIGRDRAERGLAGRVAELVEASRARGWKPAG